MITDDVIIVGSANINDRSLSGTKDSEICAVIKNKEQCQDLLFKLISEHLDKSPKIGDDIVQFFKDKWHFQAMKNTEIYKDVFGYSIPDGEPASAKIYEEVIQKKQELVASNFDAKLKKIRGHLVLFPYNFLKNDMYPTSPSSMSLKAFDHVTALMK